MSEGTAHEVVVSDLLDLQARLRGRDGGRAATQAAATIEEPKDLVRLPEAQTAETLSVVEDDLTAQVQALTERLTRLETELDEAIDRIEKIDPDRMVLLEAVHDELDAQHRRLNASIDRQFTKLQHSIEERLRGPG